MDELKIKFVGGPRDGKTRSIKTKLPDRITVTDMRKTSVAWTGYYQLRSPVEDMPVYEWVNQNAR